MDPDIKEVVALMAAKVQNLKRSRPDEVSSSPVSTESSAKKKKKAETSKDDGRILPNLESGWTTISEPKISCRKCNYVAKNNAHLKSHYFYNHLSDEVRFISIHIRS